MSVFRFVAAAALVAVGGAAGAVVRHLAVAAGTVRGPGRRAAAVAVCNLAGAASLAAVAALEGPGSWWLTAVVATGFCGALTTFSTWIVDATVLLRSRERAPAVVLAADLLGQLLVGVGICWLVLRLV